MYIRTEIIQEAIASEETKLLAAFLFFKKKYANSAYYKWSLKSIAHKLNVSRGLVRKYVPAFIERGWCRVEGTGKDTALIFNRTAGLYPTKHSKSLKVNTGGTIKEILGELLLAVLKNKAAQFGYVKEHWNDKNKENIQSVYHYRKLKKVCTGRKIDSCVKSGFSFSMSGIAKLFNTSTSTASRTIKALKQKGKVTATLHFETVGTVKKNPGLNRSSRWEVGTFVNFFGKVIKRYSNSYEF